MKKLTMKLDELRVETFTTTEQPAERGTVQGHYGTAHTEGATNCGTCIDCTAWDPTCRNIGTCDPWAGPCTDIP